MDVAGFLPVSQEDMRSRGWYYYDFLLITGDAYVDHPSFAAAVIGRVLEAEGYRVAILAQPDWKNTAAVEGMGRPRYAALISGGNLDSMVAHYTAAKKPRGEDYYSPGKKAGLRPDRAVIVYSGLARAAFHGLPVIIGGLEASLRRFSHYDYWDDKVRRPILFDAKADIVVYGMGEAALAEIASRLAKGEPVDAITDVPGTGTIAPSIAEAQKRCAYPYAICPSHEKVAASKKAYAEAVMLQYDEHDPIRGKALIQECGGRAALINPPPKPPSEKELDRIYELPYTRNAHPMYGSTSDNPSVRNAHPTYGSTSDSPSVRNAHPTYGNAGGVPAIDEVRFSITHNRGCFGACSFCALAFHQGRFVSKRSVESVVREGKMLAARPDFKGYIHDVGGPTANFRNPSCKRSLKHGMCKLSAGRGAADPSGKSGKDNTSHCRSCLYPQPCKNLEADHAEYMLLLRRLSQIPGVKKVFVRSGIRFDYLMQDKNGEFFTQLVKNHISGQLKVAPEHCVDEVLHYMGKPPYYTYSRFEEKYARLNARYGKEQFLVPYLISSHPGSTPLCAAQLAEQLNKSGRQPEQVQDFYPTPGTLSTCMYYTGLDPRTMREVYVPRSAHDKAMQRALLQWKNPKNRNLCREALKLAGREDLIGHGKRCLVPPRPANRHPASPQKSNNPANRHPASPRKSNTNSYPNSPNKGSNTSKESKEYSGNKGKGGGKKR